MNTDAAKMRAFIDALRAVLRLEPLYSEDEKESLWDAMPLSTGNKRTMSAAGGKRELV